MAYVEDHFHPAFVWAINQALAACGGASVGSGYRSVEEQEGLLYKRSQGISVADPGHSRHNGSDNYGGIEGASGGAVDMSGDLECFARAGARYGLSNTMVDGEPWHFQFTDEAWQAVLDGTYAEQYGMAEAEQPEEDSLDRIRSIVFGGAENPAQMEIPEKVKEAFAPEEQERTKEFVPTASAGFDAGAEGALSDVDAARYFAQAGFSGEALVTMLATAIGESGLNPGAAGDTSLTDGTWGPSLGLAQIRSLNDQRGTGGWRDASQLTDPAFNARAAWAISNGGTNFAPWTIWKTGAYKENLDRAKRAVASLGSDAYGPAGSAAVGGGVPEDDEFGSFDLDLFDPAGIAREIADELLSKPKTDPTDRLKDKAEGVFSL